MRIIKDISEVHSFIAVSQDTSLEKLIPYLEKGKADKEIIKVVGTEMLSVIEGYYDSVENEKQSKVLALSQRALVNLAYYYYLPFMNVEISDAGVTTNKDESAYQWQYNNLALSLVQTAYEALDDLYLFLEENESDFSDWKKPIVKDLFIKSAAEFSEYVDIKDSRRTFNAILPQMRYIEKFFIPQTLQDTPPTDPEILKFLKGSIAHSVIADAVDDLVIDISADGLLQASIQANAKNTDKRELARIEQIAAFVEKHKSKANEYVAKVENLINPDTSFTGNLDYNQDDNSKIFNAL